MKTLSTVVNPDSVKPLREQVLVDAEPYDEVQHISKRSGIALPGTRVRPGLYKGTVIAVGDGYRRTDSFIRIQDSDVMVNIFPVQTSVITEPLDVKVGDTVLFHRYEHEWTAIKQGNKVFYLVPEKECIGILEE